MSTAEVSQELTADMQGLSDEEAARRRLQFGPNALPHLPPPTLWSIALRQFKSPLIYVLGIAAVVALALGEVKDAAFIVGVLVINAIIGTIQEGRAERASQALQKLLRIQATVRRNTQTREIDAEDLVPGDLIYLESGGRVPADIRLFSTHGLEVDESLLTGESMAVNKDANWTGGTETPLADRHNMVFAGSMVIRGRCQGLAAATGPDSAVGRLALETLRRTPHWERVLSHWLVPCGVTASLCARGVPHLAVAHSSDVHLLGRMSPGLARWLMRGLAITQTGFAWR